MFSCNKNGLAFYMVSFWFLRVFSDGEAVRFSAWITHLKYNDVQSICVPNIATDSIFACNIRSSLNRIRVSAFGHISIIVTAFGSDSWHCYCRGCDSTSWLNRKGFFLDSELLTLFCPCAASWMGSLNKSNDYSGIRKDFDMLLSGLYGNF